MKTLEQLASDWLDAKSQERMANALRLSIEDAILEQVRPNKEGATTTALPNGYRIVSTAKTIFKADIGAMEDIVADWDQNLVPLKTKVELDDSKLKALRESYPKLWLEIAGVVDSKPAKTHIAVVV